MSVPGSCLKEIFSRAQDLGSPEERDRYLMEACGENTALRAEVKELLDAIGRAGDFLETPVSLVEEAAKSAAKGTSFWTEQIGDKLDAINGQYKLIQHLGEGGF